MFGNRTAPPPAPHRNPLAAARGIVPLEFSPLTVDQQLHMTARDDDLTRDLDHFAEQCRYQQAAVIVEVL